MRAVDLAYLDRVRPADGAPAGRTLDLADQHGRLLRQVAARAEALLAAIEAGRWPARELRALLGYLRTEILRQAADEETLLFPACGAGAGLTRLARDHARLRAGIEALEQAAGGGGGSPARLATVTRDVLCQLERHLAAEEATLAGPGGTATCRRPRRWAGTRMSGTR